MNRPEQADEPEPGITRLHFFMLAIVIGLVVVAIVFWAFG